MKRSVSMVVLFVVGVATGLGLNAVMPNALADAAPTARVGLGTPAGEVVTRDGHPRSITWGPDKQVWHYPGKDGAMRPRYEVNQGIVVAVHPAR